MSAELLECVPRLRKKVFPSCSPGGGFDFGLIVVFHEAEKHRLREDRHAPNVDVAPRLGTTGGGKSKRRFFAPGRVSGDPDALIMASRRGCIEYAASEHGMAT